MSKAVLYSPDDFTTDEKAEILNIAWQVCINGQDKKQNKNPMSRKVCGIMQEMLSECMIRVAEGHEEG